ncbi:MAG: MFS transporter [Candidatus Falkowbacteria bacterium]
MFKKSKQQETVKKSVIPRNVFFMGLVSLFNDIASEMVYPIIPIFLTTVLGAPMQVVGLIEGVADSTASLLKVVSGWLSDKLGQRKIFVTFGYALSTLSKLVLSFARTWHFVLGARFMDRFGKGARESARDALIMESTEAGQRGRAYGFHRAMDSMGAVIGPLLALLLVAVYHDNYPKIFLIAFIPSLIGVLLLILFVREKRRGAEAAPVKVVLEVATVPAVKFSWKSLDKNFKLFLAVSVIFAIGNSSDVFIILRAKNLGFSLTLTILSYVLFNFAYSIFSYPAGAVADKIGSKKVLTFGFILFAAVYFALGFINQAWLIWILFPLYGLYMALTDGVSRSYISTIVPATQSGTAFGAYQTVVGLCAFLASFIAGWLWNLLSPSAPFVFGGIMALIAAAVFISFDFLKLNKKSL